MDANSTPILCDGCGLAASAEHIAARMERLELATRFRPIHINVLFVALQPMPRPEDDFYRPPESRDFLIHSFPRWILRARTAMPCCLNFKNEGIASLICPNARLRRKIPRVRAGCRGNRGRAKKPATARRANASR